MVSCCTMSSCKCESVLCVIVLLTTIVVKISLYEDSMIIKIKLICNMLYASWFLFLSGLKFKSERD